MIYSYYNRVVFNGIVIYLYCSYESVCKIIDERWSGQLHKPLLVAAYYLNPQYHFEPDFEIDNIEIKNGLYSFVSSLVSDADVRGKMNVQLVDFHFSNGPC